MPAHLARSAIGLCGGAATLGAIFFVAAPFGWLLGAAAFLVSGFGAEWAFRRLAYADAIRADLEDRVRNPPS